MASTPAAGLVGRWERLVTCQQLASGLDKAGLGPLARYAWLGQTSSTGRSSFAPGSPKPTKVRIGEVAFRYRIRHGNTLMLSPVLAKVMVRQALAHPQKFSAGGWASRWPTPAAWKRVPCQSWC